MNISSVPPVDPISGIQGIYGILPVSWRTSRESGTPAAGASGGDTVSISPEAMEKYQAMKNARQAGAEISSDSEAPAGAMPLGAASGGDGTSPADLGLTQAYFLNRFPEQEEEEEPLLDEDGNPKEEDSPEDDLADGGAEQGTQEGEPRKTAIRKLPDSIVTALKQATTVERPDLRAGGKVWQEDNFMG